MLDKALRSTEYGVAYKIKLNIILINPFILKVTEILTAFET